MAIIILLIKKNIIIKKKRKKDQKVTDYDNLPYNNISGFIMQSTLKKNNNAHITIHNHSILTLIVPTTINIKQLINTKLNCVLIVKTLGNTAISPL